MFGEKSPNFGKKRSAESIELQKKNHPDYTGKNNPNYGKHHSDEAKIIIGNANKGKIISPENRKKISDAQKGKIVSLETRKKLSDAKLSSEIGTSTSVNPRFVKNLSRYVLSDDATRNRRHSGRV